MAEFSDFYELTLQMIPKIFYENSHFRNGYFMKRGEIIYSVNSGLFHKIQRIIIFAIFILKWQFLGIKPRYETFWKPKQKQDLHSGVFGGSVPEAMIELSHIFASLVDPSTGKILIKDLEKEVNPGTDSQIFAKYKINIDMQTRRNSFQK